MGKARRLSEVGPAERSIDTSSLARRPVSLEYDVKQIPRAAVPLAHGVVGPVAAPATDRRPPATPVVKTEPMPRAPAPNVAPPNGAQLGREQRGRVPGLKEKCLVLLPMVGRSAALKKHFNPVYASIIAKVVRAGEWPEFELRKEHRSGGYAPTNVLHRVRVDEAASETEPPQSETNPPPRETKADAGDTMRPVGESEPPVEDMGDEILQHMVEGGAGYRVSLDRLGAVLGRSDAEIRDAMVVLEAEGEVMKVGAGLWRLPAVQTSNGGENAGTHAAAGRSSADPEPEPAPRRRVDQPAPASGPAAGPPPVGIRHGGLPQAAPVRGQRTVWRDYADQIKNPGDWFAWPGALPKDTALVRQWRDLCKLPLKWYRDKAGTVIVCHKDSEVPT